MFNWSPEVRAGLVSAGLGMMSSKSPYFGTAVGEGGLAGFGAYQTERQRQATIPKIQAETRRLDAEAKKAEAEIKKLAVETEGAQYLLEGRKNLLNQPWLIGTGYKPPTQASTPATAAVPAPTRVAAPEPTAMPPAPPPAQAPAPAQFAATPQLPATPPDATDMAGVQPSVAGIQQTPQGPVAIGASGQPLFNLAEEYQKAKMQQLYGEAYGLSSLAAAGAQNMKIIETMLSRGQQITSAGGVMPIQGAAETDARAAAMKAEAEAAAKSGHTLKEVQNERGGPTTYMTEAEILRNAKPGAGSPPGTGIVAKQPAFIEHGQEAVMKDVDAMGGQYRTRQIVRERLNAIQEIMKQYETGHFAEAKANLVSMARSVGIPAPNFDTANPEKFQEFVKNMTANIFAQVKDIGGRVLVSEIEGLAKANANPELQPGANRAIVGQALGLINYEDKYFNDFTKWYRDHPYSTQADRTAFDAAWIKSNPLHAFTKEAEMNTPAKGEEIPPPGERTIGKAYMTPKGAARWTANGWEKME